METRAIETEVGNKQLAGKKRVGQISIYLANITIIAGLKLLWYVIRNPVARIHYLSCGKFGHFVAGLIQQFKSDIQIDCYELDYSSVMPEGGGLWYWIEESVQIITNDVVREIVKEGIYLDHLLERIEPKRRISFLRKMLEQELHQAIVLLLLAQRETKANDFLTKSVLFVHLSDLLPIFSAVLDQSEPTIELINLPNWKNAFLVSFLWLIINNFGVLMGLVGDWLNGIVQENAKNENAIAIQYVNGFDTENNLNDLWWFRNSELEMNKLVVFFDRPKNPATDEIINELKELGIHYSILTSAANNTSNIPTNRYPSQRIKWVVTDLVAGASMFSWARRVRAPFWQMSHWCRVLVKLRKWQAFMDRENIKVIFDTVENSLDVAMLAADNMGAIKIGTHWSDIPYPRARVIPTQQVYFTWGPSTNDILKEMGTISILVQVGNIFNQLENNSLIRQRAAEHHKNLTQAGVRFIVGVLDRSCGPKSLVPHPYHFDFYTMLFSLVEKNPTIGIIIKPKRRGKPGVFTYYPELADFLEGLMLTGRAILVNGNRHVLEAGYAADIVVALGINSGGLLCMLEGVRTIYWDPSHANNGPYHQWFKRFGWDNKNVVFSKMDTLIETLTKYKDHTTELSDFGDFTSNLNNVDSFRDGKAAVRIGAFVRYFLSGLDQGMDRNGALRFAIRVYKNKWGDDRIYNGL